MHNNMYLYHVDLGDLITEIQKLPEKSEEEVIRELCGRFYNGVQSYTIEDVKSALISNSWKYKELNDQEWPRTSELK